MERLRFDDNIKNTLDQHQMSFDQDEIWNNIEPHLKKKKKRRFAIIWWWGLGGIGVLTLLFGIFFTKYNAQAIFKDEETNRIATNYQQTDLDTKAASNAMVNFSFEEETCPEISADKSRSVVYNSGKRMKSNSLKKNAVVSGVSNGVILVNNTTETSKSSFSNAVAALEENQAKSSKEEKIKQRSEKKIRDKDEKNKTKLASNDTKKKAAKKRKKKKKAKKRKRIKPRKQRFRLYGQLVAAPVAGFRFLTNSNAESMAKRRKESEHFIESFSFGTNLLGEFRSGLVLYTGLEYLQLQRYAKWSEEITATSSTDGVIETVERLNGRTDQRTGPIETTTTTKRKFANVNKYRFVNFPIGLGYAWKQRNSQWRWYGGLNLNIAFRFNGRFLDGSANDNYTVNLTRNRNTSEYNRFYKRQLDIGLWTGFEYNRQVTKEFSWIIAPKIQIPLTSVTSKDNQVKEWFLPLSLNLGVNYLLNYKR